MPSRRASPNKPVRTTPAQGGRLVTRTSSEVPGFENYTWKHDLRRDLTDEIRREGDDYFRPNLSIPVGNQPFPQNQGFALSGFGNGGFEEDSDGDGIPDDWSKTVSAGITMSIDTTAYASDDSTQSVKFVSTTGGAEGYLESETAMPVTPGRLWRAAWKLKASVAGIRVDVRIVWYDEDGAVINEPGAAPIGEWTIYSSTSNPTEFTLFNYNATPPEQAVSGRLRFYGKVSSTTTTGSVWFDSVTLEEAEAKVLPINLVHYGRRPNGKAFLIVGTKTTLYRYFAFSDGDYFLRDEDPNYFAALGPDTPYFLEAAEYFDLSAAPGGYFTDTGPGTPYFDSNPGEWRVIGTGFSANGHRWEHLNINGYAVFNNGYDLPVTYQEQDEVVKPIYELREAGIVLVGTIWENSGILMGGDIAELNEALFDSNFAHESSGFTKAKQYGSVNSSPLLATKSDGGAVELGAPGSSRIVTFADDTDLEVGIDFCLEAVVKVSTAAAAGAPLTVFGRPNSYDFSVEAIDANLCKITLNVYNTALISVECSVPMTKGEYHHIAVSVLDGTDVYFFIDGLMAEHTVISSFNSPDTSANPFFCGQVMDTLWDTGGMAIAELRVWKAFRSINEVQDNATSDVTGQTGLSAYWKFDEASGTSAADSTGNGNTGTLSGGAAFIASDANVDSFVVTEAIAEASLSRTTNVSTFGSTAVHHFSTGDIVVIAGASDATFNGTFTITKLDDFTFTYANAGADTTATGAVAHRSFFTAGMAGKFLSFSNGLTTLITSVPGGTMAKVANNVSSLTGVNLPFRLYSTSIAQLTGTVSRTSGFATIVGVSTLFTTELSVGQLIRVPNGAGEEVRKVTVITDNTNLTVDSNWAASGAATTAYRVSDYTVLSDSNIFDAADIGRQLYWPDGSTRTITGFQNARRVDVDSDISINEDTFDLQNLTAYSAITDESLYDRIQYRTIWGVPDEPRTWAATIGVTIPAGSNIASLSYPIRSLEAGMQITIIGAGTLGIDFTSTILLVAADGRSLVLDAAAITGVIDSLLQRTSSIGSIAGFEDLQDKDSSAIIAGEDIRGRTVIFKDTSIWLADYTGVPAQPFAFQRVYQGDDSLYFKNTLTNPEGSAVFYAAKTGFYVFDLTTQIPQRLEMFDYIDNLFYPTAEIVDTDEIFCGVCHPTKEVFIMFPAGQNGVKGIAYDFRYKTISTMGVAYTAVNTVKKPVPGIPIGVQQDWCVCGGDDGSVILYGKANGPQEQWGGATAMFNRRGSEYTSTLRSGLFGGGWRELDITGYLPEISSLSRPNITGLTVNLYGYRNPAELPKLLFSRDIQKPDQQNLIPCFFRKNFLQDEIVVSGVNNPIRIAARSVEVGGINSESQSRRPA